MRPYACRALTLVELVITISLTAILGIPAGILFSEHLNGALRARDYTVAMSLARAEMERLDSLNDFCHVDLTVNSPAGTTISPYQGYPYALTRAVWCQTGNCASNCATPSNANNGIKRIEIRVTKIGSTENRATLVTYRTEYVLFGS